MNISGFGACMINGYPLDTSESFFNVFLKYLSDNNIHFRETNIVSLGGFPINRASKHLKRVLKHNPNLVIIQFGTTDTSAPLNNKINNIRANNDKPTEIFRNRTRYRIMKIMKWLIHKIIKISPITPKEQYVDSMEYIIKTLIDLKIQVIVLSPFIQADYVSNEYGKEYTKELEKLSKYYRFAFVNCINILNKYSFKNFLLSDGSHLSAEGHKIVAKEIWNVYYNIYRK